MTSESLSTSEAVTSSLQCLAQLAEVVDLAIEDEPHRAVLIGQRLMTCFAQIDDAQPPMAQGDTLAQVMTLVVWSAMRDRRGHPRDQIAIRPRESGYSAHTDTSEVIVRREGQQVRWGFWFESGSFGPRSTLGNRRLNRRRVERVNRFRPSTQGRTMASAITRRDIFDCPRRLSV